MIEIKNLLKKYDESIVLEHINLKFMSGKLTTLLGQNGSGKSTLLNVVSGYEFPDEGSVQYKGMNLSSINFPYIHDICFVHEKINYIFPFSVEKYVSFFKEKIINWDEDFFRNMVHDRKIDTSKNFQDYSRGQKMQMVLMIALASNVKVLLLDEITSVIDVYGRKYFLDLLNKHVKKGNTVVITTNIINELEFYTDHLVILKDMKIVVDEDVNNISNNFFKIRKDLKSDLDVFRDPLCVWAGVNSDKTVSYIIPKEFKEKYNISEEIVDRRQSTLEDVFIYYFSNEIGENENSL